MLPPFLLYTYAFPVFPMFLPLWQVIPYLLFAQFVLPYFQVTDSVAFNISSLHHQFAPTHQMLSSFAIYKMI